MKSPSRLAPAQARPAPDPAAGASRLLAAIVESSDDAIISMDAKGTITSWNRGAEKLYGHPAAEVIGKSITILIPPDRQTEEHDLLARIRSGTRIDHYETMRRRKDGSLVDVSLTISPILDDSGQISGVSKIARDISGRKAAEAALRMSEERFRLLANNVPVGIFLSDERGDCVFVNEQWSEMTGLSAAEAHGDGWARAVHPDDRARVVAGWRAAVSSNESSTAEFRFLRPDGRVVWLHGNAVQFRDGERFRGYLGSCVDITQRKLAEQQAAFLHTLADRLGAASRPEEIFELAASGLGEHLGADRCLFFELGEHVDQGEVLHEWSTSGVPPLAGKFPFTHVGMLLTRPRSQVADVCAHRATQSTAEAFTSLGIRSLAASTYWQHGRWRLTVAVTSRTARTWQPAETELLEQVVARTWSLVERARALMALRESERLYRAIGESMKYGVWVTDAEGGNVYLSDSFLQLVGLTQEECSDFDWARLLHPDDAQPTMAAWHDCLKYGTPWEREIRYRGVDGQFHPVLSRGVPIRDAHGRVLRWVGINLDISRIKRAEEENAKLYAALQKELEEQRRAESLLRESERRWRQLAEAMPNLVWSCRADGLHDFMSPQWTTYTGQTELELLGDGWAEVVHPDDLEGVDRKWAEALASGEPYENEVRIRSASGEYRWFKIRSVPIRDESGRVIRWYGSNTDVEELRRAERAVRESEQQVRLVADHAPIFLAQIDRSHRFKFVNQPYADRYGRTREDIIGRSIPEVAGAAAYEVFRPHLERALEGVRVEFEQEVPYETVERTWIHVIYEPERDDAGHVVGLIAVIMDVTARKRTELELERARDEALAASRAKDDFLAALSHELRTPLSPVLLLASDAASNPNLPREVRENFELIRSNISLEARLIDDLLDLTRITRGKMTFDRQRVDLHEVLRDALANIQSEIDAKRLQLSVSLGAADAHVQGDPVRLQQVFWNILKNAVKFTEPEGRVQVNTRQVDGHISIQIADTGIGMTAEELARVFNAFAQGDHAASGGGHRFGGLGLGLAISRRLVELHGGTIIAESPGRSCGAVFTVELPLVGAADAAPDTRPHGISTDSGAGSTAPSIRMLLVEDHQATRETLERLLGRRNFAVTAVGTAAEARLQMVGQQFDVFVSDVGLPDGDGYELVAEFRRLHSGVPSIAVSGYGMEDDLKRSHDAGFDVHLVKPLSVAVLETTISRLLGTPPASRPNR